MGQMAKDPHKPPLWFAVLQAILMAEKKIENLIVLRTSHILKLASGFGLVIK